MAIEQTSAIAIAVEIPANHRLVIDVPREVPAGKTILSFTPASSGTDAAEIGGCPICAKLRDPVTGELPFNAETIAAFEEGDAMLRGEIPTKRFKSVAEMFEDLDRDDPNDMVDD